MKYWSWVKSVLENWKWVRWCELWNIEVRLFEGFSHTVRNHDILPIKRDKCETFGSASVKTITIIQKPSLVLSSKHIWKWYYIVLNIRQQFFFALYFYKVNILHSRFRLIKRTLKTQCLKKSRKCLILSKLCWFWRENCYRFWWQFFLF